MFAKSFIDDMFDVTKLFGFDAVLFMSDDDKTRIPVEANLQASILMHVEYKVKLIDHDNVIGPQHKLIHLSIEFMR